MLNDQVLQGLVLRHRVYAVLLLVALPNIAVLISLLVGHRLQKESFIKLLLFRVGNLYIPKLSFK
jgi:hypothetical protein